MAVSEAARRASANYRRTHREKINEYQRAYRAAHPEKVKRWKIEYERRREATSK